MIKLEMYTSTEIFNSCYQCSATGTEQTNVKPLPKGNFRLYFMCN